MAKKKSFTKNKALKPIEWTEEIIPDNLSDKCNHYFEFVKGTSSAECKYCHMGLMGVYDIKDGKPVV